MQTRFSIRYKFLWVISLLLVLCVGAYLYLATEVFNQDKTKLIYELNRSTVSNISSDIESLFKGISDKVKMSAYFYRQNSNQSLFDQMLADDQDIVFLAGSDRLTKIDRQFYHDPLFLETYGLKEEFFTEQLFAAKPIPFDEIRARGEVIWNATTRDGPPLIGFAKNVITENASGKSISQFAVVCIVKADKVLQAISRGEVNEVFVANARGELLAHPNPDFMISGTLNNPLVEKALATKSRVLVFKEELKEGSVIAAFAKSFRSNLIVLSFVPQSKADSAVYRLLYRTVIFSSIILTLAFIAAILFSRSLTKPIDTLVSGMRKVSKGELDTHIAVNTKDEIQLLAQSFNQMIQDLKISRNELEEINRDLENKVKERTQQLELQNQAVKQAQEDLLRSSRLAAVGEIAGQAAHEVLNPLTSLITRLEKVKNRLNQQDKQQSGLLLQIQKDWVSDLEQGGVEQLTKNWQKPSSVFQGKTLLEEDLANLQEIGQFISKELDQIVEDTNFAMKEGHRISRIVNSMRKMSSVTTTQEDVPVRDLIVQSHHIMADLAGKHNTTIVERIECTNTLVKLNSDEFIQCMTNLIRNALQSITIKQMKDMKHEGVVELIAEENDGQVEIIIKDNGVGIPEKYHQKLFESQFSTKSKDEGTGLGLKICRRLIRAFKGDVNLSWSEEGEGAAFRIVLPKVSDQSQSVA